MELASEGFGYLNALLRVFFSIPPFCKVLLAWQPHEHEQEPSILRELQAILRALQRSGPPVSTSGLRRAFGWGTYDGLSADFEALFPLFVEALERACPELAQALSLTGELSRCSRCCHCQRTKEIPESFNQLNLAVARMIMFTCDPLDPPTLEQSLKEYLAPETMTGSNKVFCEACKDRRDHIFQVRLKELPLFLLVTLKRSSYDFESMRPITLAAELFFPEALNIDGHLPYELCCIVLRPFDAYVTVSRDCRLSGAEWIWHNESGPNHLISGQLKTSEYFINQLSAALDGLFLPGLCALIAQYAVEFSSKIFEQIPQEVQGPSIDPITTAFDLLYYRKGCLES